MMKADAFAGISTRPRLLHLGFSGARRNRLEMRRWSSRATMLASIFLEPSVWGHV